MPAKMPAGESDSVLNRIRKVFPNATPVEIPSTVIKPETLTNGAIFTIMGRGTVTMNDEAAPNGKRPLNTVIVKNAETGELAQLVCSHQLAQLDADGSLDKWLGFYIAFLGKESTRKGGQTVNVFDIRGIPKAD